MCKICDKSISERNCGKLRNYLFKMKELNGIVLGKGLFVSIKEQLFFIKGHLGD